MVSLEKLTRLEVERRCVTGSVLGNPRSWVVMVMTLERVLVGRKIPSGIRPEKAAAAAEAISTPKIASQ